MSQGRFPKPYVNDVPKEGDSGIMEYVPFRHMGIGARPSGLPKGGDAPGQIKSIDHVGGTAGKK